MSSLTEKDRTDDTELRIRERNLQDADRSLIYNYCDDIIKELYQRIDLNNDWSLLDHYLNVLRTYSVCDDADKGRENLKLMVEIFKKLHCTDSHLVTRAFRTVCVLPEVRDLVLYEYLPFFLPHAKNSRFNLWGLLCNGEVKCKYEYLRDLSMLGDIYHLHKLLMSGLDYYTETEESKRYYTFIAKIPLEDGNYQESPSKSDLNAHILKLETWKRRRLYLAIDLLSFLREMIERPKDRQLIYSCMQVMWRCIPDHYINVEELCFMLNNYTTTYTETEANEMCNFYLDVFPKGRQVIAPRTLKHLSRCCIRQTLRQNFAYSEGVASLKLPNVEKSYVLLGWNVLKPNASIPVVSKFPTNIRIPSKRIFIFPNVQSGGVPSLLSEIINSYRLPDVEVPISEILQYLIESD